MKALIALGLVAIVGFTSCVKNEYNDTKPKPDPAPVGYQNTFDDDFDNDKNRWTFNDATAGAFVTISNGSLKYNYLPSGTGTNTVAVSTGANTRRDFLVQTRIKSDNAMGLAFGVSSTNYGYSFFVDDKGYFAIYKEGDASTQAKAVLEWQYSSALTQGWNEIELEQKGDYWLGYANGSKLFEIPAQVLSGSQFGYIVLANTTGYADYLTVQW